MEFPRRSREEQPFVKGFAATLLEEVIRADVSMHSAQVDAWKQFLQHKLSGRASNITEGMPEQRYLFLDRVTLSFHIKPVEARTFWQRVPQAWRTLRGKDQEYGTGPLACEICEATDPASIAVSLEVSRSKDGDLVVVPEP